MRAALPRQDARQHIYQLPLNFISEPIHPDTFNVLQVTGRR